MNASGAPTTLNDTALSPVLSSPTYPGKVLRYHASASGHGLEFTPGGATQTEFHYVTA